MSWFDWSKRLFTFCFSLLLILLHFSCNTWAQGNNEIDAGKIDTFVAQEMKTGNIPGLAIGIVKGDRVVYLKGFGTAGPGRGEVTPQTSFIIGSVSKSFTGLALMQLQEKGAVKLTDPIKRYLLWFAMGGPEASSGITVQQLMNHTSGIPAYEGNDSGLEKGATIEERVRLKNQISLKYKAGSSFEYSSLNYDVLGVLIEAVSGQSYEEYIQRNIFAPLKMKNSFQSQEEASRKGLATGYVPWFGFLVPKEIKYPMNALPSSYIISSAEDMTHYLIAFLNQGEYQGRSILSAEGMEEAQNSIGKTSYGAGWFSSSYYKWHTGELANYNAYLCTVPSEKLGIILLSNTNDIGVKFLNRESSVLLRIPEGIRVMLMGGELPENRWLNTRTKYVLVDIVILLLLALAARVFLWTHKPKMKGKVACILLGIKAAAAMIISILLISGIPVRIKGSWHALLISVPDLTLSILVLCALLFLSSIVNLITLTKLVLGRKPQI